MTDSVDCARSATAERGARTPLGRRDRGARGARRQNGVASKWRRNGLKRLNPRPEMVVSRKPRDHKIWYTGARLTVRDSGKNDKAAELQKKAPNALKSPDAELKSAPSHNLGAGANRSG